jgi:hypothetical protein
MGSREFKRETGTISIECKTCKGYGYLLAKGDYVTYEKFQEILTKEPKEMYRLAFKLVWYLGLKNQEVLGIRTMDIIVQSSSEMLAKTGIPPETTDAIRVFRSARTAPRTLPLPKWLKEEILDYASRENIKKDQPIFNRDRTTVFQRLSKYGKTIGGKKNVSTMSLRKGFGVWYMDEGGRVEDLTSIFAQSEISLTEEFLHVDEQKAIKNLAEFHKIHSPYPVEVRE